MMQSYIIKTKIRSADKSSKCTQIFLGEKYGVFWIPLYIDQDVMDRCVLKMMSVGDQSFLMKWYRLSDEEDPPRYRLQDVEAVISKYADCESVEAYNEGFREWEKELIRLHNVLCQPVLSEYMKDYLVSGELLLMMHIL